MIFIWPMSIHSASAVLMMKPWSTCSSSASWHVFSLHGFISTSCCAIQPQSFFLLTSCCLVSLQRQAIPSIIIYMQQVMKHTIWVARCDFRFRQKQPVAHECLKTTTASVRTLEYDVRNNRSKLNIPKPHTNYLKQSICYSGALLWNNLPQEIQNLPNLSQFKRATNDCYVDI